MGLRVVAAVGVAAAVGAATASGTALDRGWAPGGAITSVDTTEGALAAGVSWTPQACEGVVLWVPWQFARYTLRLPRPCPAVSTGRGVSSVGLAGSRVVFVSYVGGNTREWRLWTVTPTARRPRLLRTVSTDAGDPSPILVGNGGQGGIPYAVGREVFVLTAQGARELQWQAPADVVSLSENAGAVGVALANGHVVVLSIPSASLVYDFALDPGTVRAARPVSGGVVIETTSGIELRRGRTAVQRFPVPAGSKLAGFVDGLLVYTTRTAIRYYDRGSRKGGIVRLARAPVAADFDRLGLGWSQGARLCWSVGTYAVLPRAPAPGCR